MNSDGLRRDVIHGLGTEKKFIPPKWLYDRKGSEIFERICDLDEYYPTRTEHGILQEHLQDIAAWIGPYATLIEPGAGSMKKIRPILQELDHPRAYFPIDISEETLEKNAVELRHIFPEIQIEPVAGDFTSDFSVPHAAQGKKVIFFPGSTIGNLEPAEASRLLLKWSKALGPQGGLIIGVDLKKETTILERAYDDSKGVTARFNLNLLDRLNRELDADFDPMNFRHEARYNADLGRIEMHLVSLKPQDVHVSGREFHFDRAESVHTENSYKYSPSEFIELASRSGFSISHFWTDSRKLFGVYCFEVAS